MNLAILDAGEHVNTKPIHWSCVDIQPYIGAQQLDFLGNCQCRLSFLDNMHKEARVQIPIFDTTQNMGCCQLWAPGHCYPFQGLV